MPETKLIRLSDGTLIEVSSAPGEIRQISGGLAEKVSSNIDNIQDVIMKACHPILESCMKLSEAVKVEQTEVELGIGFEAEGNIYVTKAKANANLTVKFTLRPDRSP